MSETTERERILGRIDSLLEETNAITVGLRELRSEVLGKAATEDPLRLCAIFADAVSAYARRPKITATWQTEARRLIEIDDVTLEQATAVVGWLTTHDGTEATFWRRNILSIPTFRKQWDRLVLAMRQDAERLAKSDNGRAGRLLELARQMPARRAIGPIGGER